MNDTTFVSIDIETTGRTPGLHSMISLGAVAYNETGSKLGSFQRNLAPVEGTVLDADTMKWWNAQTPAAWTAATDGQVPADVAMHEFDAWVRSFPGRKIAISWPAAWDYAFVYYYLIRFVGKSAFGHSALDIKTLAFALTGAFISPRPARKKGIPACFPVLDTFSRASP